MEGCSICSIEAEVEANMRWNECILRSWTEHSGHWAHVSRAMQQDRHVVKGRNARESRAEEGQTGPKPKRRGHFARKLLGER